MAMRSSSRVAQRCQSRTFFWSSEKKLSMAALSPAEPTFQQCRSAPQIRCHLDVQQTLARSRFSRWIRIIAGAVPSISAIWWMPIDPV
jgi:hypothetical protein